MVGRSPGRILDRAQCAPGREGGAVTASDVELALLVAALAHFLAETVEPVGLLFLANNQGEVLAQHLLLVITRHTGKRIVCLGNAEGVIRDHDGFKGTFKNAGSLSELFFGLVFFRHVLE